VSVGEHLVMRRRRQHFFTRLTVPAELLDEWGAACLVAKSYAFQRMSSSCSTGNQSLITCFQQSKLFVDAFD